MRMFHIARVHFQTMYGVVVFHSSFGNAFSSAVVMMSQNNADWSFMVYLHVDVSCSEIATWEPANDFEHIIFTLVWRGPLISSQ
eukprot:m.453054 g.453054  ORF g.453054 m.453054 type:complete len:84 (-) comp21545_c0_seq3:1653-1904(-)